MNRSLSLAGRYARALFESIELERIEATESELQTLVEILTVNELKKFIFDPTIPRDNKKKILLDFLESPSRVMKNFVDLLVKLNRVWLLPDILLVFQEILLENSSQISVEVETAISLSENEKESIKEKVKKLTGLEGVLHVRLNPSLIAGYIIRFSDEVIDASLAGRLARVGRGFDNFGSREVIW